MPSVTLLPADVVRDLELLLSSARAGGTLDLPVTAFSLHPHEFLGLAAWSIVTVAGCAEVVLSGVPRKASRTDCCCRVENSMFLGHVEIYKSGGASGKSHLVLLWAPPQVKSSKFMYANG